MTAAAVADSYEKTSEFTMFETTHCLTSIETTMKNHFGFTQKLIDALKLSINTKISRYQTLDNLFYYEQIISNLAHQQQIWVRIAKYLEITSYMLFFTSAIIFTYWYSQT